MKLYGHIKPAALVAALFIMAGCSKRTGEAIVVAKEYIAAGEERQEATPGESPRRAETNATSVSPTPRPDGTVEHQEVELKPLAADEIAVDGYVIKKDVQGTSKDPRAQPGLEQWRISVRLAEGGRSLTVRAKQTQFKRLNVGDRVKVRYSEGDYTGTVWSAQIVD
jgi:hypothetical protein